MPCTPYTPSGTHLSSAPSKPDRVERQLRVTWCDRNITLCLPLTREPKIGNNWHRKLPARRILKNFSPSLMSSMLPWKSAKTKFEAGSQDHLLLTLRKLNRSAEDFCLWMMNLIFA